MSLFKLKFSNPDDAFGTDLDRGDGSGFSRVSDAEEAHAHCVTRLRLFVGEVKRDVREGLQWEGLISEPTTQPGTIANHVVSVITGTPGIIDAQASIEVDTVDGELFVDFEAVYQKADQTTRVPIHENIAISGGLS